MRLVERNEHLGVRAADIVAWNERQVEATRYADRFIDGAQFLGRNDLADAVLNRDQDLLGAFKAGAARRPHVQLDDADIGGREEVGADHRDHRTRNCDQDGNAAEDEFLLPEYRFEQAPIGVAEAVEAAIEGTRQPRADALGGVVFAVVLVLDELARERRHHGE